MNERGVRMRAYHVPPGGAGLSGGPGVAARSRSRGFMLYVWIAVAIAIGGLALALKLQSSRLEREQTAHAETKGKFAAFVADTKRIGDEAKKKAEATRIADLKSKEKADAENAKTRVALNIALNSLRSTRDSAGRGGLSTPPPGSSRPDLACFDRAEYQRTYGSLVTGVRGLADEGTASTIDINTAKAWAQQKGQ